MADFLEISTFLFISVFLCCVKTPASLTTMADDCVRPGDMLNSTTQLCSAANTFCFQFDDYNGAFSYLALYNQMVYNPNGSVWPVWIGNRNEPVVNDPGELTLDLSGELKIVSRGEPIKILYSPIQPINNTKATLLDTGNFVLQQLHPNGSHTILWQSFDYPTAALLPGMKLGVNHKTGRSWSLVSWTSEHNPASGDFTLEWEPSGREMIIRRKGVIYLKSWLMEEIESFDNIESELIPPFNIVANEGEGYFTLTAPNPTEEVSFLGLNFDGSVRDRPGRVIATVDKCYGFNNDSGCQLYDEPRCWQHVEEVYGFINFTDIQNVKNDTNSSLTRFDCQRRCWNNCDCVGYSTINSDATGCTFLYKQEIFTVRPDATTAD